MQKRNSLLSLVSGSLVVLCACGTTSDSIGLTIRAVSQSSTGAGSDMVVTDDGATSYEIVSARLHVEKIELDLPEGQTCADVAGQLAGASCHDETEEDDADETPEATILIAGPIDIDLVTGQTTPDLNAVVLPPGLYKEIEFHVDQGPDDVTFAATALFDHGGTTYTLEFALDFDADIEIEQGDGLTVTSSTDLVAQFVVDNWLAGVDLGACLDSGEVVPDGTTILLSEGTPAGECVDVESTIKENLKDSGEMECEDEASDDSASDDSAEPAEDSL